MARLKSLEVQTQPAGSGVSAGPTEQNHLVRKYDLDQALAPFESSRHAALVVSNSASIALSMPSGTQSLSAALRLKSSGGLNVDESGVYVIFGTLAGQAVAGDVFTQAMTGKANASHAHLIGDTAGLQDSLDAKAPLGHAHAIGDVLLLRSELDSKAPISSTWAMSSIIGLSDAMAGKASAIHGHAIGDTADLQATLDGKSSLGHTHADATGSTSGFLTAADKTKLDALSINTYWLAPVSTKSNLPLNTGPVGACCLAKDESRIYRCIAIVGFVDDQWAPASILKKSFTIGDGASSVIDQAHNLSTWDVIPAFQNASTREGMLVDWLALDENTIRVTFGAAPAMSGVRMTIAG